MAVLTRLDPVELIAELEGFVARTDSLLADQSLSPAARTELGELRAELAAKIAEIEDICDGAEARAVVAQGDFVPWDEVERTWERSSTNAPLE